MGQIVGRDMPRDMVDSDQGFLQREGQPLGVADPHQQSADQTRSLRHRDGIQFLKTKPRLRHRLLCHQVNLLNVRPAGDLRHHTAIGHVQPDLGIDHIGQDAPAVFDDACGGLIAGAFNREDQVVLLIHIHDSALLSRMI